MPTKWRAFLCNVTKFQVFEKCFEKTYKNRCFKSHPLEGYFLVHLDNWMTVRKWYDFAKTVGAPKSICFLGRGGATKWKRFSCLHENDWYGVCDDESEATLRRNSGAGTISGETAKRGFWYVDNEITLPTKQNALQTKKSLKINPKSYSKKECDSYS